jgi:hypothetical protein
MKMNDIRPEGQQESSEVFQAGGLLRAGKDAPVQRVGRLEILVDVDTIIFIVVYILARQIILEMRDKHGCLVTFPFLRGGEIMNIHLGASHVMRHIVIGTMNNLQHLIRNII